jgi:hypothetical protein
MCILGVLLCGRVDKLMEIMDRNDSSTTEMTMAVPRNQFSPTKTSGTGLAGVPSSATPSEASATALMNGELNGNGKRSFTKYAVGVSAATVDSSPSPMPMRTLATAKGITDGAGIRSSSNTAILKRTKGARKMSPAMSGLSVGPSCLMEGEDSDSTFPQMTQLSDRYMSTDSDTEGNTARSQVISIPESLHSPTRSPLRSDSGNGSSVATVPVTAGINAGAHKRKPTVSTSVMAGKDLVSTLSVDAIAAGNTLSDSHIRKRRSSSVTSITRPKTTSPLSNLPVRLSQDTINSSETDTNSATTLGSARHAMASNVVAAASLELDDFGLNSQPDKVTHLDKVFDTQATQLPAASDNDSEELVVSKQLLKLATSTSTLSFSTMSETVSPATPFTDGQAVTPSTPATSVAGYNSIPAYVEPAAEQPFVSIAGSPSSSSSSSDSNLDSEAESEAAPTTKNDAEVVAETSASSIPENAKLAVHDDMDSGDSSSSSGSESDSESGESSDEDSDEVGDSKASIVTNFKQILAVAEPVQKAEAEADGEASSSSSSDSSSDSDSGSSDESDSDDSAPDTNRKMSAGNTAVAVDNNTAPMIVTDEQLPAAVIAERSSIKNSGSGSDSDSSSDSGSSSSDSLGSDSDSDDSGISEQSGKVAVTKTSPIKSATPTVKAAVPNALAVRNMIFNSCVTTRD